MKTLSAVAFVVLLFGCRGADSTRGGSPLNHLSVAMSPYQDIAMIVNARPLGLEAKYRLSLDLHTMAWEDILPAIASAGKTVDVGFGSLIEYLTKQRALNSESGDPVLFIYPVYVFKGGAFVTFNPRIHALTAEDLRSNPALIRKFLSYRIGAQKKSVYEMMIYTLARRARVALSSLKLSDTPLNDGILATQNGSLDIAEAGLTQITETTKQGGRVLLTMEDVGFADITGFICKSSTLKNRRADVDKLIRMWLDSTRYVMANIDKNSANSLEFLRKTAATRYTLEQYKTALSQEIFPLTPDEVRQTFLDEGSAYSVRRISGDVGAYLVATKSAATAPVAPEILDLR
jgi:hypothetical protein